MQRHQYYHSSSESDDEDECLDTVKKGVRACQSVNCNGTLGHPTLVPSSHGQKLNGVSAAQNWQVDIAANLPLPQSSPNIVKGSSKKCQLDVRSCTNSTAYRINDQHIPEIAANCNEMPFYQLESKTALSAITGCQGQNAMPDAKSAANLPLKCVAKEVASSHYKSQFTRQSETAAETVLPNNATSETQGEQSSIAANNLPFTNYNPPDMSINKEAEDSHLNAVQNDNLVSNCDGSNSDLISGHSLTEVTVTSDHIEGHDLDHTGSTPADESQADDRQLGGDEDSGRSGLDEDHPEHEDLSASVPHTLVVQPANSRRGSHGPQYRDHGGERRYAVLRIKYLQSLHNLHKEWLEWETKFRPPPVPIYSLRGTGPEIL